MTTPVKLNLKIIQGSTFSQVLRWESSTKVYKTITSITNSAPVIIYSTAHGIPSGWRAKVTNVLGMKEINSTDYYTITSTTTDTVTINSVNSLGYTAYTSGGVLEYNEPINLSGYTARMQIRSSLAGDIITELTTDNAKIVLDNTAKTITFTMSATETAAFSFNSAVYSLELVSSGGQVTQLVNGNVTLVKEVTR